MNGMIARRVVPAVLVAALLAAAAALTTLKHPVTLTAGTSPALPPSVQVAAVTRACPAPGLAGSPAASVALASVPGAPARGGKAVISRFGAAAGPALASLSQPGSLAVIAVRAAAGHGAHAPAAPAQGGQAVATAPAPGGVIIRAAGPMARGLEAEQVAAAGTSATRCDGPGTDFWFAGPGRFTVRQIDLYLMNPTSQPADVSVEAFTDAGPLQGSADTGVAVAPGSMVVQSLATMLKGSRVMALHVRTSVGQVVAAVHETTGTAGGTWLPSSQPPATRVVLPGLPATAGARQLFVVVPGTADAHLTLTAITNRGSYEPTGGGSLDAPGGSAVEISLPSLANVPGAIKVSANVPVTASVMLPGGQRGSPGVFTAACPPVQAQGVVAQNLAGAGTTAELVLSAPAGAARARIAEIGTAAAGRAAAAGAGKVVQVAARHSLVVPLSRPAGSRRGAPFAVVITPLAGSGPLYAGRVLAGAGHGGALQSILPVPAAPTDVRLPDVLNVPITAGS